MSRDAPLRFLLLMLVALTPLPLASTRPLAVATIGALTGLMLLWQSLASHRFPLPPKRPLLLAGLAVVWAIVQILPVPAELAHPGWQAARGLLGHVATSTLSVDSGATRIGILRLLTLMALFVLAWQAAHRPGFKRQLLATLAMAAGAYAAYGLAVYFTGNQTILGFQKWAYPDSLTATFVNRNAAAAFFSMGLLAAITLLLLHIEATRTWRGLKAVEWAALLAILLLLPALLLTSSRSGVASVAAGFAVLLLMVLRRQIVSRRMMLGLALVLVLFAGGSFLLMGQNLQQRMTGAAIAKEERPEIWRATIRMIADHPLAGQGLNTYEALYYSYRDETLGRHNTHAHNTYLEWGAEMGIPASLCWFAALGGVGWRLFRKAATRQTGALYPLLGLAIFTQAALHSLVDFSFQTMSNAVILAIVMGAMSGPRNTAPADSPAAPASPRSAPTG